MALLFASVMWDIGFVLISLVVGGIVYMNWNNNYWKKRGVFHIKSYLIKEFLTGSSFLAGKPFHLDQKQQYFNMAGYKFAGYFEGRRPCIMLRDPDLIRSVLVKDFDHFVNRRKIEFIRQEYFSKMLSNMRGQEWKNTRSVVSPAFTGGKMKMMIEVIKRCGEELEQVLGKYADRGEDVDIRDIFSRFTMDAVASTAFGIRGGTLKNPNSEFRKMAYLLQNPSRWRFFLLILIFSVMPFLLKWIKVDFIEAKAMAFFVDAVKSATMFREKNNLKRNDFLQLMIEARRGQMEKESNENDIFDKDAELKSPITQDSMEILSDDAMLVGQCLIFLLAGFDPVAIVLSYSVYELALHPEIQERLRDEIQTICDKHGGKCTYEAVQEMRYLDMVIHETLRKYPAAPRGERECTKDWKIPDSDVTIEKGTLVSFPIMGFHHDPKYYPNPEKFDPDRFLPEVKATRSPYVYLPFGSGPRNCVGMRYALLDAKVALVHALRNFEFSPCVKTIVPPVYEKYSANLKMKGGMWLTIKRNTS